jgi:hypothetical protein
MNARRIEKEPILLGGPDELRGLRYIIPDKLAFIAKHPEQLSQLKLALRGRTLTCVSSDLHRQYTPFCSDFGPVNLAVVHRFCRMMHSKLKAVGNNTAILYCIEPAFESLANASFLLASYLLLRAEHTPAEAADPFIGPDAPFELRPFNDATFARQTFGLTLRDCLDGLDTAVRLGWYDAQNFDVAAYDRLDSPFEGDMHQVCLAAVPAVRMHLFGGPSCFADPHPSYGPSDVRPLMGRVLSTCMIMSLKAVSRCFLLIACQSQHCVSPQAPNA